MLLQFPRQFLGGASQQHQLIVAVKTVLPFDEGELVGDAILPKEILPGGLALNHRVDRIGNFAGFNCEGLVRIVAAVRPAGEEFVEHYAQLHQISLRSCLEASRRNQVGQHHLVLAVEQDIGVFYVVMAYPHVVQVAVAMEDLLQQSAALPLILKICLLEVRQSPRQELVWDVALRSGIRQR